MMTFLMEISVPLTSFLLLWSLFDVPVVKSDTVTFSISSSAKIGDSAQFFCNATTTAIQYNAIFKHNNGDIAKVYLPGNGGKSHPNTSVTVSGSQAYYKYDISSLSCSVRGIYMCTVITDNGAFNSNTVTLDVLDPVDAIRLIPDVREWRLVCGTKKTFDCVTLGNPEPTIMWEFFPQASQTSKISWGRSIELDPDTSGVYVCTANNTVGGISYNLTKTLTVTVYVPPTPVPPSTKEPSTKPVSTTKKSGAPPAPSTDKNKIIIGSIIPILIIIIIVIIVIILYKRRAKPAEIEEPPEKPRNNHSEVNMMNTKPDLVHSTGIEKKVPMYNNGFDHGGEDDLSSMEVTFDDKPRSRKPVIPLSSPDTYNTTLPCV